MTKIVSIDGVEIVQKNYQQVLIRGDGKEQFNQIINKEILIQPPSRNLEISLNSLFLTAQVGKKLVNWILENGVNHFMSVSPPCLMTIHN